jgi:GNAT superfamily N-acetyltransferase
MVRHHSVALKAPARGGFRLEKVNDRIMRRPDSDTTMRYGDSSAGLDELELLWNALQEHHSSILPSLGDGAPSRDLDGAWRRRRAKYEAWLDAPDTFFVVAETGGAPVGYAFVTVGAGYASWATGDRLAELETLSVLPEHRGTGLGAALLDAVWERLDRPGVDEMAITTAVANVDSHRFYERNGFQQRFVVYFGSRPDR